MAVMPASRHNAWRKPSTDQQTNVSLLKGWREEGMKPVGNQAPPIALVLRIKNVPGP